eukprot:768798-Hanusia_phi.AAC.1
MIQSYENFIEVNFSQAPSSFLFVLVLVLQPLVLFSSFPTPLPPPNFLPLPPCPLLASSQRQPGRNAEEGGRRGHSDPGPVGGASEGLDVATEDLLALEEEEIADVGDLTGSLRLRRSRREEAKEDPGYRERQGRTKT